MARGVSEGFGASVWRSAWVFHRWFGARRGRSFDRAPLLSSLCPLGPPSSLAHPSFRARLLARPAPRFRYRSGNQYNIGGLTFRTPCGAVGHGGHYHSQSPEAYFAHTPGVKVVMPRSPYEAKGLLLASIRDPNPVIFLEPKALYRTSVEEVPEGDYEVELEKAHVMRTGTDVTVVGWGGQLRVLEQVRRFCSRVCVRGACLCGAACVVLVCVCVCAHAMRLGTGVWCWCVVPEWWCECGGRVPASHAPVARPAVRV